MMSSLLIEEAVEKFFWIKTPFCLYLILTTNGPFPVIYLGYSYYNSKKGSFHYFCLG